MGRWWQRITGQDTREALGALSKACGRVLELRTENEALEKSLWYFRERAKATQGWIGCPHCGHVSGHVPGCKYRHMRNRIVRVGEDPLGRIEARGRKTLHAGVEADDRDWWPEKGDG